MSEHEHDQGQPGTEQGFSEPTQNVTPPAVTEQVPTTAADLPADTQAEGDHAAAGYNAESSEVYDPAAAWAGDGYPEAPAETEEG